MNEGAAMPRALLAAGSLCVAMLAVAGQAAAIGDDAYLYRLEAVTSTIDVPVETYEDRIHYTTAGGFERTVPIAVRKPPGFPQSPLPVVIVAHGGGAQPNERNPATTLPRWGESLARAGYIAINVLHGTNVGAQRAALCQAIGFPVLSDAPALAATMQEISTEIADAIANGTTVDIDIDALIAEHPGLFEHLAGIDEATQETSVVGQVMEILIARLQACGSINSLGIWDRPYDIAAVVDALHDGALPELDGWVDLARIAVLGHSNGTSSVLNAVGLERALPNGVKVPAPFPDGHARRPVAAVALSPMGVNTYGLFDTDAWAPSVIDSKEHSWAGLTDIPVLTLTGDGDNHCKTRFSCSASDSGGKRMIPFWRMPEGDKYAMYISDRNAEEIVSSHEMFGDLDAPGICRSAALSDLCASEVKWVKSTVIAFLDAFVRDDRTAARWLRSRRLAKGSEQLATIERK